MASVWPATLRACSRRGRLAVLAVWALGCGDGKSMNSNVGPTRAKSPSTIFVSPGGPLTYDPGRCSSSAMRRLQAPRDSEPLAWLGLRGYGNYL